VTQGRGLKRSLYLRK